MALWLWQATTVFPLGISIVFIIGGIGLLLPIAWAGRRLIDKKPTERYVRWTNVWVHLGVYLLTGCAVVEAAKVIPGWKVGAFSVPTWLSWPLLIVTCAATVFAMINLALKGLGAPFAVALSRRVASNWMYAWTRNPMVLSATASLVACGLYFGSSIFVLWTVLLVGPAWAFLLKVYEERELEIRLGESYLEYKRRVPFLWPRILQRKAKSDKIRVAG